MSRKSIVWTIRPLNYYTSSIVTPCRIGVMSSEPPETTPVIVVRDNAAYSSYKAIAHVAVPAIILNAAAPLTALFQTALLGSFVSTHALAAYGACCILIGFTTRLFNFLVDGVSAKTGKSVGNRRWRELGSRVRRSLSFAAFMGILSLMCLVPLQHVLMEDVLGLEGKILAQAQEYWLLRCMLVPLMLLNMSLSGILQGFRRVKTVAALNTLQALMETGGSAAVIVFRIKLVHGSELFSVGIISIIAYAISVVIGFILLFVLAPPEADESFSLWNEVFCQKARTTEVEEPLLDQDGGTDRGIVQANEEEEEDESLLDFVSDGLNMLIRSLIMQTTFFIALMCASRIGQKALAAHAVVNQLWVLISYVVDGFAAASIVLGSRLAAQAHGGTTASSAKLHMQLLIRRCLTAGGITGILAAIIFYTKSHSIILLFTQDQSVIDVLEDKTWLLMVLIQPINSLVFVYDGLMYAAQSFVFIRNYFLIGFCVVFVPMIVLQMTVFKTLWAVWMSKALFNIWRCAGAAYLIHYLFMAEFDPPQ